MPFWKKKIPAEPLIDLEPANAHQVGVRTLVVCPVAGCEHCCIMPALWEHYWGDPSGELYCPTHDEPLVDIRKFIGPFSQRIAKLMFDPTINPPPDLDARIARVDPTVLKQFHQIWKFLMFYVRGAEKWAYIYNNWEFNTPAKNLTEDEKTEQLYTLTRVPRGKGLAHEDKNRFEVYHDDQDWIAQYIYYYEKKIGSFLPDGFKWKNIMEHFHEIAEWRPESWNVINPPAARLPRLSSYVLAEIASWLNERIQAIGWGMKRLLILKQIPEEDLETQMGILNWYCVGQTAALFLNYETRVWNSLDPQLYIRTDKRPIPLDWAHSLGFPVAKGHLPMRIDPILLLQYYNKFYEAGLTQSNAEQARVRFDKNGGSVVSSFSINVEKTKPSNSTSIPTENHKDSTTSSYSTESIPPDLDFLLGSLNSQKPELIFVQAVFGSNSIDPPQLQLIPHQTSSSSTVLSTNTEELDLDSDTPCIDVTKYYTHDQYLKVKSEAMAHTDPVILTGGFYNIRPLRCKLDYTANVCVISPHVAKIIMRPAQITVPYFCERNNIPEIKCNALGRIVIYLDEDQSIDLDVFVAENNLPDTDILIGDTAIGRYGLIYSEDSIIARFLEEGYIY